MYRAGGLQGAGHVEQYNMLCSLVSVWSLINLAFPNTGSREFRKRDCILRFMYPRFYRGMNWKTIYIDILKSGKSVDDKALFYYHSISGASIHSSFLQNNSTNIMADPNSSPLQPKEDADHVGYI